MSVFAQRSWTVDCVEDWHIAVQYFFAVWVVKYIINMISIIIVVGQLTSYMEDSNSDKTMEVEDGSKSETVASIGVGGPGLVKISYKIPKLLLLLLRKLVLKQRQILGMIRPDLIRANAKSKWFPRAAFS